MQTKTIMTAAEIHTELLDLNETLKKAGKVVLTPKQLQDFPGLLEDMKYTREQFPAAKKYIVYGHRRSIVDKSVQLEYFFPTETMLQQFKNEFVHIELVEARLDEQWRRYKAMEDVSAAEYLRLSNRHAEACVEIERLTRIIEASEPKQVTPEMKKFLDDFQEALKSDVPQLKAEIDSRKRTIRQLEKEKKDFEQTKMEYAKTIFNLTCEKIDLKNKLNLYDSSVELNNDEIQFQKQREKAKNVKSEKIPRKLVKGVNEKYGELASFNEILDENKLLQHVPDQKQVQNTKISIKKTGVFG